MPARRRISSAGTLAFSSGTSIWPKAPHRQADLDLVLVVAVDRTARNPGGVRQVGHGSSAHALFQENPLGGIEYAVAGFLGFLFGFPGH
ncbi:hypothetical protein PA12_gene3309 [Pseudomonas aeruginosa]|nr:hypothetical protein PA12_gene3309 [Pseudomonas aeruginosa]